MGGIDKRAARGRRPPSGRRGGIVAEAYKAAIRAGISDDQFWSSTLCALRQRIEKLERERNRANDSEGEWRIRVEQLEAALREIADMKLNSVPQQIAREALGGEGE